MTQKIINKNEGCKFNGNYAGRDMHITNITMSRDCTHEFIVTHNRNIRSSPYFVGRETELCKLRKIIENASEPILININGEFGVGKTQICKKIFEEYGFQYASGKEIPFKYIGYFEYYRDMNSCLQNCLIYEEQANSVLNKEAAWRELERLASSGNLLLIVDNVNQSLIRDHGLRRLISIPAVIILSSRQNLFNDKFVSYNTHKFVSYNIHPPNKKQCMEIYERIRYENSDEVITHEEVSDLEYIVNTFNSKQPYFIELMAYLARTKHWSVSTLSSELNMVFFIRQAKSSLEILNNRLIYERLHTLQRKTNETDKPVDIGKSFDDKTVFISYSRRDDETANRIDKYLSGCPGIIVKRDIRDIDSWKSIRAFMTSIRKQDYVILIVSDSYLRSQNCMFEVTEIMKDTEYESRMLLVVVENKIYNPFVRLQYVKYWQEECGKLEEALKELNPEYAIKSMEDLKRYKSIASSIGEFLSIVADRNNPDIKDIEKELEKAILKNRTE